MPNIKPSQKESKVVRQGKHFLQLIVSGIGLGVISGSILQTIVLREGTNSIKTEDSQPGLFTRLYPTKAKARLNSNFRKSPNKVLPNKLSKRLELTSLSHRWNELASRKKGLEVSAFLYLIDNGKYAKLSPDSILPAASSIKTSILVIALKLIDLGELKWNEELKLTSESIGGGAGWMAYQKLGKKFPLHEVATEMIRVSDNTATNLLIKRIGGKEVLNKYFKKLGLNSTKINNLLPDLEGTNTTSAKDLVRTIQLVDEGKILGPRTRDLFREVMSTSTSNRLLPAGMLKGLGASDVDPDYNLLIKGYRVYNKTGDIGIAYADAGLIELPDNSRAIAGFIVKGPFNDPRSPSLIREMAAAMTPILTPKDPSEPSN